MPTRIWAKRTAEAKGAFDAAQVLRQPQT